MAGLDDFLQKFSKSEEVPMVLLHLANANEFNAEEKKAREQYEKLVANFAATESGKQRGRCAAPDRSASVSPWSSRERVFRMRPSKRLGWSASRCLSCSGRARSCRSRPTRPT